MKHLGPLQSKLTYANVVSTLCLFLLLSGGAAYAVGHLGKNSVGAKQLRKNSVTTAKIRKRAVTAGKVKDGTLTGKQINVSTLGTVPAAQTADTANLANSLAPSEAWHEVGAPGEPGFQNGWANAQAKTPPEPQTVAFYRDHEGVVHLKGIAGGGAEDSVIFQLPAGYRPTSGRYTSPGTGLVRIYGSATQVPGLDGAIYVPNGKLAGLDGITFRAES